MDKVEKVFTLVYNNSKLKEELIKKQTIDEMYEYCTSISGGYTREEFDKFVNEMCQYVKEELTNKNLSISDEDMKKVLGGTQLKNKAISSLLAAMTISTPLVGAASNNQENTDIPVESKTSITQKIKDFVSKNPITTGITSVGIPTMVILGITLQKKNEQERKTAEERRVEQEKRAADEAQVAQDANQITRALAGTIDQLVELLADLDARLKDLPSDDADLTEENVGNAETALQALGSRLEAATDEMNINQAFINTIAIPEIKNNVQNIWNDTNERITRINTDYNDALNQITAKRNTLKDKYNENVLKRPRM